MQNRTVFGWQPRKIMAYSQIILVLSQYSYVTRHKRNDILGAFDAKVKTNAPHTHTHTHVHKYTHTQRQPGGGGKRVQTSRSVNETKAKIPPR